MSRPAAEGVRNGCTRIYGALTRAGKALGYRKALTYTRVDEPGTSLLAAGFRAVAKVKGRQHSCESRPRKKNELIDKIRWERDL